MKTTELWRKWENKECSDIGRLSKYFTIFKSMPLEVFRVWWFFFLFLHIWYPLLLQALSFELLDQTLLFWVWHECNNSVSFLPLNSVWIYFQALHSILYIIYYPLEGKAQYVCKMKWKVNVKKFKTINSKVEEQRHRDENWVKSYFSFGSRLIK